MDDKNIGKTLFDTNHTNFFLCQFHNAIEAKFFLNGTELNAKVFAQQKKS